MKKILLGLLLCSVVSAGGQKPAWVNHVPPRSATYYYRASQGAGDTPEKAITHAFIMAICESAFAVDLPVDMEKLLKLPEDSVLVSFARFSRIPINKVCWYTEPLVTTMGYRAYVLCQVARDANVKPQYKTFNCLRSKEENE